MNSKTNPNASPAERMADAAERQAAALEEIAAGLHRLTAAIISTPVPTDGGTYGAGLVVRTTDGLRHLGEWEITPPPHLPDCLCMTCKAERKAQGRPTVIEVD